MTFPFTFPHQFGPSEPAPMPNTTALPPMRSAPHILAYPAPPWDNPAMDPNLRPSVRVTGYLR